MAPCEAWIRETDSEVPVERGNMTEYDFTDGSESACVERLESIVSTLLCRSPSHTLCGVLLADPADAAARKWKAFTHRACSLQNRFDCCFCIVTRLAWCISRPQTLGMCRGDIRDAVIPHYIIERERERERRGGKRQGVRPDAHRQLNASGTQDINNISLINKKFWWS